MDKADAGIIETLDDGGANGGTQDQEDQKDLDTQLEQGDESLNDGGAEHKATRDQADEVEGEVLEEDENAEPDLETKLNEFKNEITKTLEEKLKPTEEKAQPITEERWLELEKEWAAPRQTIDRVTRQSVQVFDRIKAYVDEQLAGLQKDDVVARVAKENGITDHARLKAGVDEFMKDYAPQHHSNPVLIKKALIYARGLTSGKDLQRARSNGERNRQVINKIKGGTGENRGGQTGLNRPLSAQERQAAEMMPGGEKAYREMKSSKSRVIAV